MEPKLYWIPLRDEWFCHFRTSFLYVTPLGNEWVADVGGERKTFDSLVEAQVWAESTVKRDYQNALAELTSLGV